MGLSVASALPTNPQETLPICSQGMWPPSVAKCFMAYIALLCMLSHQILVTIQRQAILLRFPFYSLNFNFSLDKVGIIVTLFPKYSLDQHTHTTPSLPLSLSSSAVSKMLLVLPSASL